MWEAAVFTLCRERQMCPAETAEPGLGEMNYTYCIDLGAVILQVEVKLWALACSLVIDSCENDR